MVDNFSEHHLKFKMGVSVFPNLAPTAKKLIKQAIYAVEQANDLKDGNLYVYSKFDEEENKS